MLVGASTGKGPSSNFATKLAMAAAKGAYSAARGLVFSGAIMAMDDGGKSYEADPPSARAKKKAKKKAKKAAVGTRAKKQAKKK